MEPGDGFDEDTIRVMGTAFECARSALHISIDDPGSRSPVLA